MGDSFPEAESKEKNGVWNPMPKLTINLTLCPIQSRLLHIYHQVKENLSRYR